jgi:hypothetical protein
VNRAVPVARAFASIHNGSLVKRVRQIIDNSLLSQDVSDD